MAAPNLISATTIIGSSTGRVLTTATQDIVVASTSSVYKLNHLLVTNITTGTVLTNVGFYDAVTSSTYFLLYQATVPANAAVDVLNRPFYLEEGDKITASSTATSSLHITASWEIVV